MTTAADRARHIRQSITNIQYGLGGLDVDTAQSLGLQWSGFIYELLVISEASRHLPDEWKAEFGPDINWRQMADLGNRLRHGYHRNNTTILWAIFQNDLPKLEAAIDRMLAARG